MANGEISINFDEVFANINAIVKHIADLGSELGGSEGASEPATADFIASVRYSATQLGYAADASKVILDGIAGQLKGVVTDFAAASDSVDADTQQLLATLESLSTTATAPKGGAPAGGAGSIG